MLDDGNIKHPTSIRVWRYCHWSTGTIRWFWAELMLLFSLWNSSRWFRLSMVTEPIPSGSTVCWTLPPQWAGSAKQILRTKFSTCVFVFFFLQFSHVTFDICKWSLTACNRSSVSYLRDFKKNQTNQANTQQKQMSSVLTVWFIYSVPLFFIMWASLFHSPNKTDFIKAKYQMLAYVHRMPCREDDSVTAKDLSKVWSSSPCNLCYDL